MKNFIFLLFLVFFCSKEMISQQKLILQPNAEEGKDALIWYIDSKQTKLKNVSNKNLGSAKDFKAVAWTYNGNPDEIRGLIEFDFKKIPKNVQIISAYLSLYADKEYDGDIKGHTFLNANTNECLLKRIIEPWNENQVTWNTQPKTTLKNAVIVHKSEFPYQNYEDINVTQMVKNIIEKSENNYGFMFSVKDFGLYKSLIFASSDHPNPKLHPKLVITYTKEENKIFHFKDKQSDKYVVIIYDDNGEEIKRVKGVYFNEISGLERGTYHFNLMKNKQIISAGKFIIY